MNEKDRLKQLSYKLKADSESLARDKRDGDSMITYIRHLAVERKIKNK